MCQPLDFILTVYPMKKEKETWLKSNRHDEKENKNFMKVQECLQINKSILIGT